MTLQTWRFKPAGHTNAGDELGPWLLKQLGIDFELVKLADAEFVSVGSIIEQCCPPVTVWGAGFIKHSNVKPNLEYLAVRGRLTSERLGLKVPMGDPGLLVSKFVGSQGGGSGVGWCPHYVDDRTIDHDVFIDVKSTVEEFASQISSCDYVYTSSLHGAVVAHSYGIPYVVLPHDKVIGNGFKFADFESVLDENVEIIQDNLTNALFQWYSNKKEMV